MRARQVGAGFDLRKLCSARESKVGARRIDACQRRPQVIILYHRSSHKILKLFVFENFKPLEISDRRLVCWCRGVNAPKRVWNRRSVGFLLADYGAAQQANDDSRKYQL